MDQRTKSFEKSKGKSHLDKDFLEELKHKLWSTKGSRFRASERLKIQNKYSVLSISILSAYIIIFGLLSVYNLFNSNSFSENLIPFTITSISIFLLVFSLFENSKSYEVRALQFHQCGLEISRLYNDLQTFKSYKINATEEQKELKAQELYDKYQKLLEKYENHLQIDNKVFKLGHRDYYEEIKWHHAFYIKITNFFVTYFWYYIVMIVPVFILIYILLKMK